MVECNSNDLGDDEKSLLGGTENEIDALLTGHDTLEVEVS